jgi:hypothetical protein
MAKSKLVKANKEIEKVVVGSYKKIENGVVGGFNKISDKFVDNYLTREGESVAEAKERLAEEQKARLEKSQKEMEDIKQHQQGMVKESIKRAESHRR